MERNQFWLFFGFALLLGLAAAAYQHAEGISIGAPHLHNHLDDEGPMFSGNDHMHLGTGYDGNSSFSKIAGLISHLPIHLGNGEKTKKPDAKAAAKVDPKKKKDDKKKKKSETKIAPGITAPNGDGKNGEAKESTGMDGSGAAAAPPAGASAAASGAGQANNGIPKTLEEWVKYIIPSPSLERTQFMIQMYQTRLLTADIYFQVMTLMTSDTRDQMRLLGVMAAGSAPSSNSFHTLLTMANSTSEVSSVRSQATSYLRTYAQLNNISYLMSVLTENATPSSVAVALNLLQLAAKPYAGAASTTGSTSVAIKAASARAQMLAYQMQRQVYINEQTAQGQEQFYNENGQLVNAYSQSSTGVTALDTTATTAVTLTAQQKKLNKYFAPFVSVLTSLVKTASTAALRTSATTTLALLNQVVTPTTSPTGTTTTPTTTIGSTVGATVGTSVGTNVNGATTTAQAQLQAQNLAAYQLAVQQEAYQNAAMNNGTATTANSGY